MRAGLGWGACLAAVLQLACQAVLQHGLVLQQLLPQLGILQPLLLQPSLMGLLLLLLYQCLLPRLRCMACMREPLNGYWCECVTMEL